MANISGKKRLINFLFGKGFNLPQQSQDIQKLTKLKLYKYYCSLFTWSNAETANNVTTKKYKYLNTYIK